VAFNENASLWTVAEGIGSTDGEDSKLYKFVTATVSASSEAEARMFVKAQDTLDLPWDDSEYFECQAVTTFGDPPAAGDVFVQWTIN
jgi:hypothetical protein